MECMYHLGPVLLYTAKTPRIDLSLKIRQIIDSKQDEVHAERNMLEIPSYKLLKDEYDRYHRGTMKINTLIVRGPKGCGKTTSLRMLCKAAKADGENVLYYDMTFVDVTDLMVKDLLNEEIEKRKVHTLFLDNSQLFRRQCVIGAPFVVAVFSPSGCVDKCVFEFAKFRGDGRCFYVYFSPLNLDWSKKLMTFLNVKVGEDSDTSDPTTHPTSDPISDGIYFLTQPPSKCTRSKLEQKEKTEKEKARGKSGDQPSTVISSTPVVVPSIPMLDNQSIHHLQWAEFLKVFYLTGGVPRYLTSYIREGHHDTMDRELTSQMLQYMEKFTIEKACEVVLQIALLNDVNPLNSALINGLAYLDGNRLSFGYLVSPKCIHLVLQHNDLLIASGDHWQKLQLITLFKLCHMKCRATNHLGDTIELSKPSEKLKQDKLGEMPCLSGKPECLIALASGHPIIDCVLVSYSKNYVCLIQTSFSRYSLQKKKRSDLFTTLIKEKDVYSYFSTEFPNYQLIYVYATPQFEHKVNDDQVYFIDLKSVLRW